MSSIPRNVQLHPTDHLPSTSKESYDVIVVGSGPVGRALCARTAAAGLSTVCVEQELFGGDCPFWACIPSKALLRPGEAIESARQISGAKELIRNDLQVDSEAIFARRDKFVQKWNDKFIVDLVSSQDVEIIRGTARLVGDKAVEVVNVNGERSQIQAIQAVVLATGSTATIPNISGLNQVEYWTPRHATSANEVPQHLIIVGGGVVGCEMATAYATLGSKVSLVCSARGLLSRFEPEAGRRVKISLEQRGAQIHLAENVDHVGKGMGGGIDVQLRNGEKISGSHLLLATGRKPTTEDIGLEELGIDNVLSLEVDDSLCVKIGSGKWLYAIGDANGRNPLTHMGVYQARAAALTIIARARGQDPEIVPWSQYAATADHVSAAQVVVTDPNVASAGLTLAEAKKRGMNVKEVAVPFIFPGAWVHAEFNYDGWAQWVIDTERHVLVGATIVGREAADLLHASTVAIVGQVPMERLWHAVASFPTMSEIYSQLLLASGY
jgi:pyruvate/2-oxoglutarate dehydrogenase complex dihydrolipoamide dehydrogenase (E3) component